MPSELEDRAGGRCEKGNGLSLPLCLTYLTDIGAPWPAADHPASRASSLARHDCLT